MYYDDDDDRLAITWLNSYDSSFECDRPQTQVYKHREGLVLQVAQWYSSRVPFISWYSVTAYTTVSPFLSLPHQNDEPSIAIQSSVTVVDLGKLAEILISCRARREVSLIAALAILSTSYK